MTVNTLNIVSGPYVGNDIAATFDYTFRVENKNQLAVYQTIDDGAETILVVDTDYTVDTVGDDAGGTITRIAGALPTTYKWWIRADYKETQLTEFASQGGFLPAVHEAAMDKMTFLIQQLGEELDRSLKIAVTSDLDPENIIEDIFEAEANTAADAISTAADADRAEAAADRVDQFDTKALMIAATLTVGELYGTKGFTVAGDGGGGDYLIVSGDSSDGYVNHLVNGGTATAVLQYSGPLDVRKAGAVVDGNTDDYPSVNAAIEHLSAGGSLYFPGGTCAVGSPLVAPYNYLTLLGEGVDVSIIKGTHSSGPVIHFSANSPRINGITINASATRTSGALGTNYGILVEPPDTSSGRIRYMNFENFTVDDQPNHGIVVSAGVYVGKMSIGRSEYNGGHGLVFDNGTLTGRTNLVVPGLIDCEILDLTRNGGNSLVIGGESENDNRAVRMNFNNCEFGRSAESAGTRRYDSQVDVFGSQINFNACAFNGLNIAGDTASTKGIRLAGRGITVNNCRWLNVATNAAIVENYAEFETADVLINSIQLSGDFQGALDPAVEIANGAEGVRVYSRITSSDITSLSTVEPNTVMPLTCLTQWKNATTTINNSTTLTAIEDFSFRLYPKQRAEFEFNIFFDGPAAADIKFAVNGPSGIEIFCGNSGGVKEDSALGIVVSPAALASGSSLVFGTNGSGTGNIRMVTIKGSCETTGTGGDVTLSAAQNTATVGDTRIFSKSTMKFWV
jgi:hypothetical protein